MSKKRALITGITGQDGAYLTDLLLSKDYEVYGVKRRSSSFNTSRIDDFLVDPHNKAANLFLEHGDLSDSTNLIRLIQEVKPDEIYNLAAMSHVHVSFETPEYSADIDAMGTLRILEAIRILGLNDKTKIYQASSSELYGKVQEVPQTEKTPFYPRSPYAVAKLYSYWITVNYREAYQMFCCNGILFNHESPLRGETFVTRKITRGVANLLFGDMQKLYLGNLNSTRDWGHAKDYVQAMWLILQQEQAEDYVISTGKSYSVRDFLTACFNYVGIRIQFEGEGSDEIGSIQEIDIDKVNSFGIDRKANDLKEGDVVLNIDPYYYRPTEVEALIGDSRKAQNTLGWKPKYGFKDLVSEMMEYDIQEVQKKNLNLDSKFNKFNPFSK
tara:strand:- start:546 stop:1697 length:1152 start_codon:yes stop_codon:yes gene_type:complete